MSLTVLEENKLLKWQYILDRIKRLEDTIGHVHDNKSILDMITAYGSGRIITDAERDAISQIGSYFQRDFMDNTTEIIVVGNKTLDRMVIIEYTIESELQDIFQGGTIRILHNDLVCNLDNYLFGCPKPIENLYFQSDISGTDIRLKLIAMGVGFNLKFKYGLRKVYKTI